MMPDDAVLLCCTVLAAEQHTHPYPVGAEWARLRAWYTDNNSPTVSKQEAEYWLLLLADFIRSSDLPTPGRVRSLQAINNAIYTIRDQGVAVTQADLWRWTQAVSWAKAAGMIHTQHHTTPHALHSTGGGLDALAVAAQHATNEGSTPSGMFALTPDGRYRFSCGEIPATRRLLELNARSLATIDAFDVFREWITTVSEALDVPEASLIWDTEASNYGGGFYNPHTMQIVSSVVDEDVVLHEYRHHLQYLGAAMPVADMDEDARAWSRELLRIASP